VAHIPGDGKERGHGCGCGGLREGLLRAGRREIEIESVSAR
jgi:hypothetical protein